MCSIAQPHSSVAGLVAANSRAALRIVSAGTQVIGVLDRDTDKFYKDNATHFGSDLAVQDPASRTSPLAARTRPPGVRVTQRPEPGVRTMPVNAAVNPAAVAQIRRSQASTSETHLVPCQNSRNSSSPAGGSPVRVAAGRPVADWR